MKVKKRIGQQTNYETKKMLVDSVLAAILL